MSERYRLTRLVATGGMAEVYLGLAVGEEGFEKPVAVKRVLANLAADQRVAQMFLAEAGVAKHLHHQNIVEVFDVGRANGALFMVMELVNGWDLTSVLDRLEETKKRLPPHLAALIALQVISGLAHAYRKTLQGKPLIVAHRDVSPSNVLLSTEGEVKLADFGIARIAEVRNLTEPGDFKGKVAYTAPEVLSGEPASWMSDQFSLGIVLGEMLAGVHPYGRANTVFAYIDRIRTQAPQPLVGVPTDIAALTMRLMARNPAERYPSPDAISRALAEYLARTGQPASSAELASFLSGLGMPPPFSERQGPSATHISLGAAPTVQDPAVAPSMGLSPVPPIPEFSFDADWQPSGKVMDERGQLEAAQPRSAGIGEERTLLRAPTQPEAPAVSAPPLVPAPAPTVAHPPDPPWTSGEPLELARSLDRGPPVEGDFVAPVDQPSPRSIWPTLVTLLVVAALGAGGYLAWPMVRDRLPRSVTQREAQVLFIDSVPQGAKVRIGGKELGVTPFAHDNLWPPGEVEYQLSLKGYVTQTGRFRGGQPVQIAATLVKKR